MLQVRQRELHFGEGERVMLSGIIFGHPVARCNWKAGIRASTPSIDFMKCCVLRVA